MKYHKRIIRFLSFALILLITSCSTYRNPSEHRTFAEIKTSSPQYVYLSEGRVEYYRFGHGSPIIFIAGYATDVTSWDRRFLARLAQEHEIILVNNRKVAGSDSNATSYQSEDLANDIYQLILQLQLKKPAIVGISMGGMIAQQLAILHPDAIGHLVLINTSIAGKKALFPDPKIEKKLLSLPPNHLGFYVAAVDLFFPPSWRVQMAYALAADRFVPRNYTEVDLRAIMPKQRLLIYTWLSNDAAAAQLGKLTLPVLVLNGEADIVIPPKNSEILATAIPNARLVRWKQGGHAMIFQYPDAMGDEINNFIAS